MPSKLANAGAPGLFRLRLLIYFNRGMLIQLPRHVLRGWAASASGLAELASLLWLMLVNHQLSAQIVVLHSRITHLVVHMVLLVTTARVRPVWLHGCKGAASVAARMRHLTYFESMCVTKKRSIYRYYVYLHRATHR